MHSAQSKSCKSGCLKDGPSPQEWPFGSPSPHPFSPTRARAGKEERSAPAPRGQTAAGSAAPLPSPSQAAGPLSPRIMHGPGSPRSPAQGAINVHHGESRGNGQRGTWRPKGPKLCSGPGEGHPQLEKPECSHQAVGVYTLRLAPGQSTAQPASEESIVFC